MKFGLSRMRFFMRLIHNPQNSFPSIHIAGTNGKGSVAAMLAHVYKTAGYRVGLYTSPHLEKLNERFQINGKMISDDKLKRMTMCLKKKKGATGLTHFEFLTALAFRYFSNENVDLAIIETGLGGRLDATNIIQNGVASVITNIGLEHTEWLGSTIEEIAAEKGGIIKPKIPVFTAAKGKALNTIKKIAKNKKANLVVVRKSDERQEKLGLNGRYQQENALLAISVIKGLKDKFPVRQKDIERGLKTVKWPGRFEVWRKRGKIVIDAAHNPSAVKELTNSLKTQKIPKVKLLMGVLKDKDSNKIIKNLAPYVKTGIMTQVPSDRSENPYKLMQHPAWRGPVVVENDIRVAMKKLMTQDPSVPVLVMGSLFLVGEVRKILRKW